MAVTYEVPDKYYFRIHHIRPRFKNDVENVLIYMSLEISKVSRSRQTEFMEMVFDAIRRYPGNATKTPKTIDNWRTEISALFGLIGFDVNLDECWPSAMSNNLAVNQDLVQFFKYFLYYFQYPGGHLKPHETLRYINAGVKFKPAKYILSLLVRAEENTGRRFGITKAEFTHCVFNDLRVTKDNRPADEVVDLIISNRKSGIKYDWTGDVIRYAGDILDYMTIADLLVLHGNKYYLNWDQKESIAAFLESELYFAKYDPLYEKAGLVLEDVNVLQDDWFHYVNQKIDAAIFKTDLFKYLGIDESVYSQLPETPLADFLKELEIKGEVTSKEIGDIGEFLVHGHECMRLKIAGKSKLIHIVKRIPSAFAVGCDVISTELDGKKRFIEVKTTISRKGISFANFHMTNNEWNTAESVGERYFVYRLMVSKEGAKLFVIQDPVEKYKSNNLQMSPEDGVGITFSEETGKWEKLLIWKD